MSSDYTSLQKAQDAIKFAESRFGQHYIKRLQRLRKDARQLAENLEYTDSFRAHQSTRAAAMNGELEYFRVARTIIEDKGLVKKLKAKASERKEAKKQ